MEKEKIKTGRRMSLRNPMIWLVWNEKRSLKVTSFAAKHCEGMLKRQITIFGG
jgi:hypothetical protein